MELQQEQQEMGFDINSRVREIEGKYNLLRDRALIINQNMILQYKKNASELVMVNDDLKEMKADIFKLKETIRHLVEEVNMFARKEDLKVLEKYISFWNPLKFVTENEVREMIEREVKNAK